VTNRQRLGEEQGEERLAWGEWRRPSRFLGLAFRVALGGPARGGGRRPAAARPAAGQPKPQTCIYLRLISLLEPLDLVVHRAVLKSRSVFGAEARDRIAVITACPPVLPHALRLERCATDTLL
jgi:hypothetical protein